MEYEHISNFVPENDILHCHFRLSRLSRTEKQITARLEVFKKFSDFQVSHSRKVTTEHVGRTWPRKLSEDDRQVKMLRKFGYKLGEHGGVRQHVLDEHFTFSPHVSHKGRFNTLRVKCRTSCWTNIFPNKLGELQVSIAAFSNTFTEHVRHIRRTCLEVNLRL